MQQENVELYPSTMKAEGDNSSRLLPSPLWSHLQDFFANTLISVAGNSGWGRPPRSPATEGGNEAAPRRRGVRHDKLLSDSIGECLCTMTLLIRDVVASCPPLIDRVWNLYSSLFAPYAEPLPSDRTYHRPIYHISCSFIICHQIIQKWIRWLDNLRSLDGLRRLSTSETIPHCAKCAATYCSERLGFFLFLQHKSEPRA